MRHWDGQATIFSLLTGPLSVRLLVSLGLGLLTAGRRGGVELPECDLSLPSAILAGRPPPVGSSSITLGLDCDALIRRQQVLHSQTMLCWFQKVPSSKTLSVRQEKGSQRVSECARPRLVVSSDETNYGTEKKVPCATSVLVTSTNEQWRAL